jgi:hypothetical protein
MPMRTLATGITVVLCLNAPAMAEMYKIENPASNIYNPATRMDNPNPISPPTQPVPQPAAIEATPTPKPTTQIKEQSQYQPQPKHNIPNKSYRFKSANEYIDAANKSSKRKDYKKALSITEEALRRIRSGTLKASKKTKQKLNEYRASGYKHLGEMKAKYVKAP